MNSLKTFLVDLHEGKQIDLELRENQHGEMVAVDYLYTQDGAWMRGKLNCWSASDYDFGTCRCISHNAFHEGRIPRKEVLEELRKLLRKENEDRTARDSEIAWLEEQIKAL